MTSQAPTSAQKRLKKEGVPFGTDFDLRSNPRRYINARKRRSENNYDKGGKQTQAEESKSEPERDLGKRDARRTQSKQGNGKNNSRNRRSTPLLMEVSSSESQDLLCAG
jgi:hypothetical protein